MSREIGDHVLRIAREIAEQRVLYIEWRITSMPRDMHLCFHDGVIRLEEPRDDDNTVRMQFASHVIVSPEACEWRGRREVYSVPEDMPRIVGQMCRCIVCCCPEGEGHNSPGWREWVAAQRVKEDAAKDA